MAKLLLLNNIKVFTEKSPAMNAIVITVKVRFGVKNENGTTDAFGDFSIVFRRHYTEELTYSFDAEALASIVATDAVESIRREYKLHGPKDVDWNPVLDQSIGGFVKKSINPQTDGKLANGTISGGFIKPAGSIAGYMGTGNSESAKLQKLAQSLPGKGVTIEYCPANKACPSMFRHGGKDVLRTVIHLNDFHKWNRHQIADWADGLHDEGIADLSFTEATDD